MAKRIAKMSPAEKAFRARTDVGEGEVTAKGKGKRLAVSKAEVARVKAIGGRVATGELKSAGTKTMFGGGRTRGAVVYRGNT